MTSDLGWCKITCLEKVRLKDEKKSSSAKKKKETMHLLILWALENKQEIQQAWFILIY